MQKKARLEATVNADADNTGIPHQQSENLAGLNGSSCAHVEQLAEQTTSLTSKDQEAIPQILPAGAIGTPTGGNELSKLGSREKRASEERSPGPFGSNSRGSDIFGSRPSRQKPFGTHSTKAADRSVSAAAPPEVAPSQKSVPEVAGKSNQSQKAATEGRPGFGKMGIPAFGSEQNGLNTEQKTPGCVLNQVFSKTRYSRVASFNHQPVHARKSVFWTISG